MVGPAGRDFRRFWRPGSGVAGYNRGGRRTLGIIASANAGGHETVEAQKEDVPFDLLCRVDSEGNAYDFGLGMNWAGVIQDGRTAKYRKQKN